ncbi:DUF547 domain-containing protein [Aquimarina sp. 2304DJ70-9]|uniref:DUF547 domain-containing protein n=1 Tax=Aquimarina penaris TaxID=3231044 RepID=UPI003461EE5C
MKPLKTPHFILAFLLCATFYAQEKVDHSSWDQILILNVLDNGMVDYDGVTKDVAVFYDYFRHLCKIAPKENWTNEEKLAYWLNVYNATAMKMIIDEYPVASINDLENPWKRKVFKTQGVRYSLDDIEHGILRKFGDPRIHFLLNCGSMSSPRLWNRAYTSENINEALEERTREFINDPQRNQITSSTVKISQVFEWYKEDFESYDIDVADFINQYATVKINKISKNSYITYDWSLNKKSETTPITSNH